MWELGSAEILRTESLAYPGSDTLKYVILYKPVHVTSRKSRACTEHECKISSEPLR